MWVHHKGSMAVQGLLCGTICPSPPKGSLTEKLTTLLVSHVVPWTYACMQGVPESGPLPMLPNLWGVDGDEDYNPIPHTMSSFSKLWHRLMTHSKVPTQPTIWRMGDALTLGSHPFQHGTYMARDCRRQFITAFMEYKAEIMQLMDGETMAAMQAMCARQVGNTPKQWKTAYDMLLKTTETRTVNGIMHALNSLLKTRRERWQREVAEADANAGNSAALGDGKKRRRIIS